MIDKKVSETIPLKDASIDCVLSSGLGFVTGFVLSAVFTMDDITFAAVAGVGSSLSAFGMKTKHQLVQSPLSLRLSYGVPYAVSYSLGFCMGKLATDYLRKM